MSCHKQITLNGEAYYDIGTFASIVGRDVSYISFLINRGNKVRPLRHIRIGSKPLIVASEVEEYPFDTRKHTKKGSCHEARQYNSEQGVM